MAVINHSVFNFLCYITFCLLTRYLYFCGAASAVTNIRKTTAAQISLKAIEMFLLRDKVPKVFIEASMNTLSMLSKGQSVRGLGQILGKYIVQ